MTYNYKDVAARFREFMLTYRLTQNELAEKINVSRQSISNVLTGRNGLGAKIVKGIGRVYPEVNINYLVSGGGKLVHRNEKESIQETNSLKILYEIMQKIDINEKRLTASEEKILMNERNISMIMHRLGINH